MKYMKNSEPKSVLFFPFAGGSGEVFAHWFKAFSVNFKPSYYTLPGRGCRYNEQPFDNIEEAANEIVRYVLNTMREPYYFFGHSMGALITFELCRRLYFEHSIEVKAIFVSGHRAPNLPSLRKNLHLLDKESLFEELCLLGGFGNNVTLSDIEPFLPTIYADLKLCECYVYKEKPPLPTKIIVLSGIDDQFMQRENISDWQKQSILPVEYHEIPGDHFYIHQHYKQIINIIEQQMNGGKCL
jgi:medium-chain acyl-[acyl-carrier-protein] hydrolase